MLPSETTGCGREIREGAGGGGRPPLASARMSFEGPELGKDKCVQGEGENGMVCSALCMWTPGSSS